MVLVMGWWWVELELLWSWGWACGGSSWSCYGVSDGLVMGQARTVIELVMGLLWLELELLWCW